MSPLDDAVRELVDRICDDRASPDDLAALQQRLEAEARLVEPVLDRLRLESQLRAENRSLHLAQHWAEQLHQDRLRREIMAEISERDSARWSRDDTGYKRPRIRRLEGRQSGRLGRPAAQRRRRPATTAGPALALVAGLAVATILALLAITDEPSPATTAYAVILDAPALVDDRRLDAGTHHLPLGSRLAAEGSTLVLADGSRLLLAGSLRLPSQVDAAWQLDAGRVACTITPRGPTDVAFQLHTVHGRVRVIGTRFSVAIHSDHSLVRVSEGRVAISDQAGTLELEAGEEARLGQRDASSPPDWQYLLIDPATGARLRELADGDTIDLDDLGPEGFNIEISPPPPVTALRFAINGGGLGAYPGSTRRAETEFEPPLTLYGDVNSGTQFRSHRPEPGPFVIRVVGYRSQAGEEVIAETTLRLSVGH